MVLQLSHDKVILVLLLALFDNIIICKIIANRRKSLSISIVSNKYFQKKNFFFSFPQENLCNHAAVARPALVGSDGTKDTSCRFKIPLVFALVLVFFKYSSMLSLVCLF